MTKTLFYGKTFESRFYTINRPDYSKIGYKSIMELAKEGKIKPYDPNTFAYTDQKKSKIIESMLLGYPQIFQVVMHLNHDQYEFLAGYQEVIGIADFINGKFKLKSLTKLRELNGLAYDQLDQRTKNELDSAFLYTSILSFDLPKDELDDIYDRLKAQNSNAVLNLIEKLERVIKMFGFDKSTTTEGDRQTMRGVAVMFATCGRYFLTQLKKLSFA